MILLYFVVLIPISQALATGSYNVDEVRHVLHEPDLRITVAGIDPDIDLNRLTRNNVDGLRKRILTKYPSRDDQSYEFMTSKSGQRFACRIPQASEIVEKQVAGSYNPRYIAQIVNDGFLMDHCVQLDKGWWKYELCRGMSIRQFHGEKNEKGYEMNSLGMFAGRFRIPEYQRSTVDRLLYFEESYENGTLCNLFGNKIQRKTLVRYECDPELADHDVYISHMEESATCQYLVYVKIGSLCKLAPFIPPSKATAFKIACHPYLSIEQLTEYLDEKVAENERKAAACLRLKDVLVRLHSAARVRLAMARTELSRNVRTNYRIQERVDYAYSTVCEEYFFTLYEVENGHAAPPEKIPALIELAQLMYGQQLPFQNTWGALEDETYDFATRADEDSANSWFYFTDPHWNKMFFPYPVEYVMVSNNYYNQVYFVFYGFGPFAYRFDPTKRFTNPFKYNENALVGYYQLNTVLKSWLPSYFPTEKHFIYIFIKKFATGQNGFESDADMVATAFFQKTEQDFLAESELQEGELVRTLADQLAPFYLAVELYGDQSDLTKYSLEKVRKRGAEMLDRMVLAYRLAQIRFDHEQNNSKLTFAGKFRGKLTGKESQMNCDRYYRQIVHNRPDSETKQLIDEYKKAIRNATDVYHKKAYRLVWKTFRDGFLLDWEKRRQENQEEYARVRKQYPNGIPDGLMVPTRRVVTSSTLLWWLHRAGLTRPDLKIEPLLTVVDDFPTDIAASLPLDWQLEDILAMQRMKFQASVYQTVIKT